MKKLVDKQRSEFTFDEGDSVMVKLQPYRRHSLASRKNKKLSMRYFGPFQIIKKIGSVPYQLLLPENTRIHSVFHVSLLKKFEGNPSLTKTILPLPLLTTMHGPVLQAITIL